MRILCAVVLLSAVACSSAGVGARSDAAARWQLDPAFPVSPADTTVHLIVHELMCATGGPAGSERVLPPDLTYEDEYVGIVIKLRPGGPGCMGNEPFPLAVELSEPIGSRQIVNDGTAGPRVFLGPTRRPRA